MYKSIYSCSVVFSVFAFVLFLFLVCFCFACPFCFSVGFRQPASYFSRVTFTREVLLLGDWRETDRQAEWLDVSQRCHSEGGRHSDGEGRHWRHC